MSELGPKQRSEGPYMPKHAAPKENMVSRVLNTKIKRWQRPFVVAGTIVSVLSAGLLFPPKSEPSDITPPKVPGVEQVNKGEKEIGINSGVQQPVAPSEKTQ